MIPVTIPGLALAGTVALNTAYQANAIDLVLSAGWVAKIVLLILLAASVFSWAVIIMKHRTLKAAQKESHDFLNVFWYGQDLEDIFAKSEQFQRSPVATVFKAGFKELKKISQLESAPGHAKPNQILAGGLDNVHRALNRTTASEVTLLEKSVGLLATVGSTAPFVGLFGTVWGIMDSFQGIGATGNANLAVVAPGISEALIATAAGLLAAIPAVVAYNFFVGRIKTLATEMDTFGHDFMNIVQRSLLKSH